jgi:subtilisin family serine protease
MKQGGIRNGCLLVLVLACGHAEIYAAVPAAVADALLARAASLGEVRVIVQFSAPGKSFAELPAAARASRVQQIANLQANLANRVRQPGVRELVRFRTIPFMVFSADVDAIDRLANLPEVIGMKEDSLEFPALASSIPIIGADTAWAAGYDGTDQVIAVLDTGVDTSHPYFPPAKLVAEACFSSDGAGDSRSLCPGQASSSTAPGSGKNCTSNIEVCKHGTHVAGIALGNDGTGPNIGVARGAGLIAIQVFSCTSGNCMAFGNIGSYESDQVRGLEHVLMLSAVHNIAAVNMSLGGTLFTSQATCDSQNAARKAAIDNLRAMGIATIIASGNDNSRNGIKQPGCISSAISVGNTTNADVIYSHPENPNVGSNVASFLDLLAPGTDIISAAPGGLQASNTGTSMSTPHVAGAWAVLRQAQPLASIDDILQALRHTGTSVNDQRIGGTVTDMRRVNLDLALDALTAPQPEIASDPVSESVLDFGSVHVGQAGGTQSISLSNSGGDVLTLVCALVGADSGSFQIQQCPVDIGAGDWADVELRCKPQADSQLTAQLQIQSNDTDETVLDFSLQCLGLPSDTVFADSFEEQLP